MGQGKRRLWRVVVPLFGAAALALALALAARPGLFGPRCEEGAARAAALWSPEVRAQAEQRFKASPSPAAGPAWKLVAATLDGWAAAWRDGWTRACALPGGPEARAQAARCLEARLSDFEVLVELFKSAEGAVIDGAPFAFDRLYVPEPCLGGETLTLAPLRESPSARLEVTRSRLLAAQSDAARLSGRHASAMRLAKEALALAERAGHLPAQADALLAIAEEERARANDARAAEVLARALGAAESGRHFEAIVRIAVQQLSSLGTQPMKPADAEAWLARAQSALEKLPRPELEAEVQLATALLRISQGAPEGAVEPAQRAAETFFRLGRPARGHDAQNLQARALALEGRPLEAAELEKKVVEGRAALLGPEHPQVLRARMDLGEYLVQRGSLDEGITALIASLDTARLAGLPMASQLLASRTLAFALTAVGRHEEALIAHRAVLTGLEQVLGPAHRHAAAALDALADGLREAGKLEEAEETHQRARERWEKAEGASRAQKAASHAGHAWTLALLGRSAPALEEAAKALALAPEGRPPFGWAATLGAAWAATAAALLEAGKPVEARAAAERGLAVTEEVKSPEVALARARALSVLGDVERAQQAAPQERWQSALNVLGNLSPSLAPELRAELTCKLEGKARRCGRPTP